MSEINKDQVIMGLLFDIRRFINYDVDNRGRHKLLITDTAMDLARSGAFELNLSPLDAGKVGVEVVRIWASLEKGWYTAFSAELLHDVVVWTDGSGGWWFNPADRGERGKRVRFDTLSSVERIVQS